MADGGSLWQVRDRPVTGRLSPSATRTGIGNPSRRAPRRSLLCPRHANRRTSLAIEFQSTLSFAALGGLSFSSNRGATVLPSSERPSVFTKDTAILRTPGRYRPLLILKKAIALAAVAFPLPFILWTLLEDVALIILQDFSKHFARAAGLPPRRNPRPQFSKQASRRSQCPGTS